MINEDFKNWDIIITLQDYEKALTRFGIKPLFLVQHDMCQVVATIDKITYWRLAKKGVIKKATEWINWRTSVYYHIKIKHTK